MINVKHIAQGWGKSLGWLQTTPEESLLSIERLNICATSGENGSACEHAKPSSLLKLLRGEAKQMDIIYCDKCGCPATEKSLVTDEKCPLNKW